MNWLAMLTNVFTGSDNLRKIGHTRMQTEQQWFGKATGRKSEERRNTNAVHWPQQPRSKHHTLPLNNHLDKGLCKD